MITTIDLVRWLEGLCEVYKIYTQGRETLWDALDEEYQKKIRYILQSWPGLIKAGEEFKTVLEAVKFFEDNDG